MLKFFSWSFKMAVISERMSAFIAERLEYLKSLKEPNQQQEMLIDLGNKFLNGVELSATELRGLKTLAAAEKAAEKAAAATRAARKLVSTENEKARKERTRNMINAAGLLGLAGLLDKKTGKPLISNERLLGALVELANRNPTELEKRNWDDVGAKLLAEARNGKNA